MKLTMIIIEGIIHESHVDSQILDFHHIFFLPLLVLPTEALQLLHPWPQHSTFRAWMMYCFPTGCGTFLCISFRFFILHTIFFCGGRDEESNRPVTRRDVFKSSDAKAWFVCAACKHRMELVLGKVTRGGSCTFCRSKTETKVFDFLATVFALPEYRVERRAARAWCRYIRQLPFDI